MPAGYEIRSGSYVGPNAGACHEGTVPARIRFVGSRPLNNPTPVSFTFLLRCLPQGMPFYLAVSRHVYRASRLQGTQRNRTLAVKHQDGEPLTRVDLQYDLLYYLFADPNKVFNDPYPTLHGDPAGTKVTFRDLYINTLLHSPRCSKVSREKLQNNFEFADEFAKIALLSNVGRINTTMACKYPLIYTFCSAAGCTLHRSPRKVLQLLGIASRGHICHVHRRLIRHSISVFPEMRTALRTYHPVPSLQKTDGNLQDAPRIKNILKSCLLPTELQNMPATPAEVLSRAVCTSHPCLRYSLLRSDIGIRHSTPYDYC